MIRYQGTPGDIPARLPERSAPVRDATAAVYQYGPAVAGAPAWSAPAGSANPSAMRSQACGFMAINLTHKSTVRPEGLPGRGAG
jgi:hypothetical protein